MPSSPLGSTHGARTSGVACHHSPWTANRVERREAWHDIIAFKPADTVGRRRAWHAIIALGRQTRSNDVGRGMTSLPLDSTHGRQRLAWHDITAFGQHTWSDYVGRGMTSLLLDSTHGRTTSGVVCHHRLWAALTVERCWAWNNMTAFGQHTRSNSIGRDMPSPPFDSTFFERC